MQKTSPVEEMLTFGTAIHCPVVQAASSPTSIWFFSFFFFPILQLGQLFSIRQSVFRQVQEQSREVQVQHSTAHQLLVLDLQQLLKDKAGA